MGALILALTSHQLTYSSVKTLGIHMPSPTRTHRSANARGNHMLPRTAARQKSSRAHRRKGIVLTQCEVPHYEACIHSQACRDTAGHTTPPLALFATPGLYLGLHAVFWPEFLQWGGEPSS